MSRELPFMQFYVSDWMSEPSLRMVSHEAKGVWMDMLCLMWNSPERGRLLRTDGKPYTTQQLARAIGYLPSYANVTLDVTLTELVDAQVCDVTDGVYECRRMIREQRERAGSALRMRTMRSDKKSEQKEDVTPDVTHMLRIEPENVTPLDTDTDTDTDTERDTDTDTDSCKKLSSKKSKRGPLLNFGEFQTVRLTSEEHAKIVAQFGEDGAAFGIDTLDGYKASNGKRYANDYAVFKAGSWLAERINERAQNSKKDAENEDPAVKMLAELKKQGKGKI